MRRIKVLQLQPKYYIRTSDLHEEIIRAMPTKSFDVTAAYLKDQPKKGGMKSVSETVKYFNLSNKNMKGLRIKALYLLWKYCRRERFDVVISHRFKPLYMMLMLNKLLRIPRCIGVVHAHGGFDREYRRLLTRSCIDERWRFVAVSDSVKRYLIDCNCGFTDHNVSTVMNALDVTKTQSGLMTREQARAELGLEPEDFVFGNVARLVRVKGHDYLIEAFSKIREQSAKAKLVIIGDGELRSKLQECANAHGLSESVIFTGEKFDAYRFLKAFDVFVLSSLNEGLPLAVLEAIIAKLPVLATNVGGVSALFVDKSALMPPADADVIYREMAHIMAKSITDRQSLVDQLYDHVVENFSIEAYRETYRRLVSEPI